MDKVIAQQEKKPNSPSGKYQLFQDLTDEEYQALKNDIAEHGILVPIEKDEAGEILDGHHRVRAWGELRAEGIKVPDYEVSIRVFKTEGQKLNHIRALNLLRRHLTTEQQKPHWEELRKAAWTYRAIADASGVEHSTVLRALEDSQCATAQSEITNTRGQKRPSHYKPRQPKTVKAFNRKEEGVALGAIQQAGHGLPDKTITTKRASRIGREQDAERRRESMKEMDITRCGDIDLRIGYFQEKLKDVSDIDLILTDPPYGNGSLDSWQSLSAFASDTLKPGGWLITYSGQLHLNEVLKSLGNLKYIWVIAQVNTASAKNIVHEIKFYSQWKPLLIFAKPPVTPLNWVNDILQGGGRDKSLHDWQQAEAEAVYCIENFSTPGALVVDPFLGSGTNAVAAKRLGRRFVGCDIDPANISKAWERLNGKS